MISGTEGVGIAPQPTFGVDCKVLLSLKLCCTHTLSVPAVHSAQQRLAVLLCGGLMFLVTAARSMKLFSVTLGKFDSL